MMEIREEPRENCHTKVLGTDDGVTSGGGECEILAIARNSQKFVDAIENKQNIGFGAEIPTTMNQPTKTETIEALTTNAAATETERTTCAEVVADVPLDVPEVQMEPLGSSSKGLVEEDGPYESEEDDVNEEDEDDDDDDDEDEDEQNQNENSQVSTGNGDEDDDPDNSDDSTSDSDFSDLSGLSDESGREWKPNTKPINWVQKQIHSGANPRELLSQMLPNSGQIASGLNDMTLWRILASMLSEPPRRQKLRYINTFADVIQLVRESKNIIVLTGAGVSVSCGIPDFRSSDGIYSRLAKDFPDLPDPQAMFDINYFSRDPRPFYKFAREIYPGQFTPSPCHRFIKLLETKQKLLRNYTQNIDTLEQVAGIQNVIECHGSFSTASCTKCKFKTTADAIREDIFTQRIPVCPRCQPNVQQSVDASEPVSEFELKRIVENGIMKPDIVFFGEGLPEKFHTVMASDKDKCDLLIVMGSSLKVRPVALIPSSIPAHVPQILINREQLHHLEFDVELLGDSDVIINQLCHHLGSEWKEICFDEKILRESTELLPNEEEVTEEEDAQQFPIDTDTQSVKSNASTDIALRSAGGYSDSGFESSTSSGIVGKVAIGASSDTDSEATEAIQKIKSSILELSEPVTKPANSDLLPPDLLDEHMDAVDFENPTFHPFNPTTCPDSYRHLSIDSSKDSGIQCNDSSNSATATMSTGLLPPLSNFSDSGGTIVDQTNLIDSVSASATPTKDLNISDSNVDGQDNKLGTSIDSSSPAERKIKIRQQKRLSAAERLLDGTYYCHESSSSYVFPGAQVSWCTDSELDEDEEEDEDFEDDDEEAEALQTISPLLPPSVEAEMVTEITTSHCGVTTTASVSTKRHSSESVYEQICSQRSETVSCCINKNDSSEESCTVTAETTSTTSAICSPPPIKKRRDTLEESEEPTLITTTISGKTTTTLIASSGNNSEATSTLRETTTTNTQEALLQQL